MNSEFSNKLKAEARSLGFFACGIAKADAVEQSVVDSYRRWIAEGCNASMAYLENYPDKRFDPRLLVPGVRSISCITKTMRLSARQAVTTRPPSATFPQPDGYRPRLPPGILRLPPTVSCETW